MHQSTREPAASLTVEPSSDAIGTRAHVTPSTCSSNGTPRPGPTAACSRGPPGERLVLISCAPCGRRRSTASGSGLTRAQAMTKRTSRHRVERLADRCSTWNIEVLAWEAMSWMISSASRAPGACACRAAGAPRRGPVSVVQSWISRGCPTGPRPHDRRAYARIAASTLRCDGAASRSASVRDQRPRSSRVACACPRPPLHLLCSVVSSLSGIPAGSIRGQAGLTFFQVPTCRRTAPAAGQRPWAGDGSSIMRRRRCTLPGASAKSTGSSSVRSEPATGSWRVELGGQPSATSAGAPNTSFTPRPVVVALHTSSSPAARRPSRAAPREGGERLGAVSPTPAGAGGRGSRPSAPRGSRPADSARRRSAARRRETLGVWQDHPLACGPPAS